MDIEKSAPPSVLPLQAKEDFTQGCSDKESVKNEAQPECVVVSFEPDDPENPHNWNSRKRLQIILTAIVMGINSTLGSALTSNLMTAIETEFHVPDGPQSVLPVSMYLCGFVVGPLFFAPMSETYGRQPILWTGYVVFVLAMLASSFAPNWPFFLVFRLISGIFSAPPTSVLSGVIADVFPEPIKRGQILMMWSAMMFIGPLGGPLLSAFVVEYSWRWSFWIAIMIAGVSSIVVIFIPETLATKILRTRAKKLNKANANVVYVVAGDMDRKSIWRTLSKTLSRPFRLLIRDPMLIVSCIYMAFVYAIFYMMLDLFPDIFENIYGFSVQKSSGAFPMIGFGTFVACITQIWFDKIAPRIGKRHPDRHAECIRLPMACVGGPTLVIALLWLGWTSRASIHWVVPLLATIPYGFAYQMIFQAMTNYVADAYGIQSASALAACSTTRSIAGALIPLGINNMISTLGPAWVCTVLALISAGLCPVPFAIIAFGKHLRRRKSVSPEVLSDSDSPGNSGSACEV